jgi:hypothetical protein
LSKVILGKRLTGHDRIYSKAMANESNGETWPKRWQTRLHR